MAFKPERSLKVVLTSLFSQYRNENGVSATRVQAVYRQTMGDYISNHTTRIYMKNNVKISQNPYNRNNLNEALGEQQIKEIKFH